MKRLRELPESLRTFYQNIYKSREIVAMLK